MERRLPSPYCQVEVESSFPTWPPLTPIEGLLVIPGREWKFQPTAWYHGRDGLITAGQWWKFFSDGTPIGRQGRSSLLLGGWTSWFPPVVSTDTCVERGLLPAKGVENPAPPSLITLVVGLGTHPIRNWIRNIAPHLSFANIIGHGATVISVVFNLSRVVIF